MEMITFIEEARQSGMKQGFENGMKQGVSQGINQRNMEIAKNLLEQNVDISIIMSATGLKKEEIENLSK